MRSHFSPSEVAHANWAVARMHNSRRSRQYEQLADKYARKAKQHSGRLAGRYSRIARHYARMAKRAALHGRSR